MKKFVHRGWVGGPSLNVLVVLFLSCRFYHKIYTFSFPLTPFFCFTGVLTSLFLVSEPLLTFSFTLSTLNFLASMFAEFVGNLSLLDAASTFMLGFPKQVFCLLLTPLVPRHCAERKGGRGNCVQIASFHQKQQSHLLLRQLLLQCCHW